VSDLPEGDAVAEAYNRDPEREWGRLARDAYRQLEFDLTWDALTRRLSPGMKVLDAGGGPGRYSLALCRAGFRVTLFDLSPGLLAKAREQFEHESLEVRSRLEAVELGDLRDLARYADGTFDAVVCLGGPLSHIPAEAERRKAAEEMARVVRLGGLLLLTGIGYLAVMRWMLNYQSDELISADFEPFFHTGDITGATQTLWHFFRAAELRALGEGCGLETIEMLGCQGLSSGLVDASNRAALERPDLWVAWRRLVLRTASEPSLVDTSEHILWVGKKETG
jgi:SAM-dependent methyltransferase